MRGLLADVNVDFHVRYLRGVMEKLGLWPVLVELHIEVVHFSDLRLPQDLDDRQLWERCQTDGWVLLTENRNHDGTNSLSATLDELWTPGHLPVLTLANKQTFEESDDYRIRVANDIAELLFGVKQREYLDRPRIFVPFE